MKGNLESVNRSESPGESMKKNHTPYRTCVNCRQRRPKWELVRLVRSSTGDLAVDIEQKLPGRGGYLCRKEACLVEAVKKHAFARILHAPVHADIDLLMKELIQCPISKK
jgi:uncharacterized protein